MQIEKGSQRDRFLRVERTIDMIDAIAKVTDTAAKFTMASKNSDKKKNYKRSRGFRSRAGKQLETAEIGMVTDSISSRKRDEKSS